MPIKNQIIFAGGCLAGALGMYYSDPHRGAYRRAILKDKSTHFKKVLVRQAEISGRDLGHRTRGAFLNAKSRLFPEPVADDILVARVASKIGRVVANPHSLGVSAERGKVILTGPLFTDEVEPLLHVIRKIPGVRSIEKNLDPHGRSEHFPGLQGHRRLRVQRPTLPPAFRLLVSLAGGVAALSGSLFAIRKKAA